MDHRRNHSGISKKISFKKQKCISRYYLFQWLKLKKSRNIFLIIHWLGTIHIYHPVDFSWGERQAKRIIDKICAASSVQFVSSAHFSPTLCFSRFVPMYFLWQKIQNFFGFNELVVDDDLKNISCILDVSTKTFFKNI